MIRRSLKLLLLTTFSIAALGQHHKAFADIKVEQHAPIEERGYLYSINSDDYVFSYTRSSESKTLFGIAINTPNQNAAENGLKIPTIMIVNCLEGNIDFYFTENLPTKNMKENAKEKITQQAQMFCRAHKRLFKHAHW